MSTDIEKIKKLNDLVALNFKAKHTVVLNPGTENRPGGYVDDDILYDEAQWKITDELKSYVEDLSKDTNCSIEDKILLVYEKICKDYVYDDNLISYIKKEDEDVFSVPDWYGRVVDSEWEKNRESHNRRVCFELSRYVAQALTELSKDREDFNVAIIWNKDLTHYFVALTCDDYSITLDTDDFFNIKDLTRIKAGLTAKGITVLEDDKHKFKNALEKFNLGRTEHATRQIENAISENDGGSKTVEEAKTDEEVASNSEQEKSATIAFLEKAMEILTQKYKLDSQGLFEYMKEIVDIRLGRDERGKIWKKIKGETEESTRFIRCLIIRQNDQVFIIDVDSKQIHPFNEKELNERRATYIPYKEIAGRSEFEYYDGT